MQSNLFSDKNISQETIKGLTYISEYIDQKTENELLSRIDNQCWMNNLKRRVQHYGYKYDYKARNISYESKLEEIPDWLEKQSEKLFKDNIFADMPPDQIIVNEYMPGQGISPHVDCIPCFKEVIASLSLNSGCSMNFIHSDTKEKISIFLEPRSLIILSNEARYKWQHSIPQRKSDIFNGNSYIRKRRVSLTFRNVILAGSL